MKIVQIIQLITMLMFIGLFCMQLITINRYQQVIAGQQSVIRNMQAIVSACAKGHDI